MDECKGTAGRDKSADVQDRYVKYRDRFLFQVRGVLDMLSGPTTCWLISEEQGQKAFKLAIRAMDQWLKEVRSVQERLSEKEMADAGLEPYKNMGNPVLWCGVLLHKVVRDGTMWDQ